MKILYIAHSAELQGSGIALLNILKMITQKNITPVVLLPAYGTISDSLKKQNIKFYVIKYYNETYPHLKNCRDYILFLPRILRTFFFNIKAKNFLSKVIELEHPDIIHTNTGVLLFPEKIARKYNIPHVWHAREFLMKGSQYCTFGGLKRIKDRYHSKNNHCIAITRSIFEFYNLDFNKDCIIYDGVFSETSKLDKPTDEKIKDQEYFLYVGSLDYGKGIYDVIESFNQFYKLGFHTELWLAGNDSENVMQYLSNLPCKGKVRYLGFRKDIYSLMQNAKALIVASYNEGFGFITAEAMYNKCLVIGRNVSGTKEQFENGKRFTEHEVALKFTTVPELVALLLKVQRQGKATFNQMIEHGYKTVTHFYTIEESVDKLSLFYKRVSKNE